MGDTIDAIKNAGDAVKGQLTMKPEQLDAKQLSRATAMSKALTEIRKFSYIIIPVAGCGAGIVYFARELIGVESLIYYPMAICLIVFYVFFVLFNARDYLRGTI